MVTISVPARDSNPFDSSGVRPDENGVRRYTDLHESIIAMLRETVDVLPGNFQVLIVDGVVAGLWHQRRSGTRIDITVESLLPLTARQRDALDRQAERVGEILEARPRLTIGPVTAGGHA